MTSICWSGTIRRDMLALAERGMMVLFDGPETSTRWIVRDGKRHFAMRWAVMSEVGVFANGDAGLLRSADAMGVYISASCLERGRTGS